MERIDLVELHYILPITNLRSILEHGLLSNARVATLPHHSVAAENIQGRRSTKTVPGGFPLHNYVNLYFHARNPMLYLRKNIHTSLCVLRISPAVLDLPNVIITSQNASSDYVRFYPSPDGLANLDKSMVFAESWIHADQIEEWQHKSIKCAEVLVPNQINSVYIMGGYVSNQQTLQEIQQLFIDSEMQFPVTISEHLFFLGA